MSERGECVPGERAPAGRVAMGSGGTASGGSVDARSAAIGHLATLAAAEVATGRRLRALLAAHPDPIECWHVVAGRASAAAAARRVLDQPRRGGSGGETVGAQWARALAAASPDEAAARCRRHRVGVAVLGDDRYPAVLAADPDPPALLFGRGDWTVPRVRRVAIVGTRNATATGLQFAAQLGRDLVDAGVCVVSGLALGIDAAAHRGALSTGSSLVVGVVANGVVEPYPVANAALWEQVARAGLLISEWPPGTVPERFRFPQRNRIIAGLAEIVVVVESRERGGSLSTVAAALERGVEVLAVPGSVMSRASRGTNELLRDGAGPVMSADDVLVALGLTATGGTAVAGRTTVAGGAAAGSAGSGDGGADAPAHGALGRLVVERCSGGAVTFEQLVATLDAAFDDVAVVVAGLVRDGWLRDDGGWLAAARR